MNCEECKERSIAVPYIAHEAAMARQERTIKRLWIALILVILLLFGSNLAWTIYENQFETVSTSTQEVEQRIEADGAAVVAGIGDAVYGNESHTEG